MALPIRHGTGWRLRWINEHGKRESLTIQGAHNDALFVLRGKEQIVEEIKRGIRAPLPPKKTFGELCDYYLEHYSSQKRRAVDDTCTIRAHLRPYFGHLLLAEVENHVDEFRTSRMHLSKVRLHCILTLLIAMLRVAHDKEWLAKLPKIKKPKIQVCDSDYSYLRSKDEISRFLVSAKEEGELVYTIYVTAIYSGLRLGELAGLNWADIDFEKRLIHVSKSFDGPTKNGRSRWVPLFDTLLPILAEWKLRGSRDLVFPNQMGEMYNNNSRIFQETLKRILCRAGFPREPSGRHYITFHDLRHSFASHFMMGGGDLFRLQKILGHSEPKLTMRYAHLSPDSFVQDRSRFGVDPAPGFEMAKVFSLGLRAI